MVDILSEKKTRTDFAFNCNGQRDCFLPNGFYVFITRYFEYLIWSIQMISSMVKPTILLIVTKIVSKATSMPIVWAFNKPQSKYLLNVNKR